MHVQQAHAWTQALRAGGWFASLPAGLAAGLVAQATVRPLAAGQRLFARGEAGDGIYCVLRGAVRITGITRDGSEALLALLEPPQWFGEIALFDNAPRTHDAWAESDALLLHVALPALQAMLDAHPGYWKDFGRLLAQKMRAVFAVVEDSAVLPATARVASRLAAMAGGFGAWHGRSKRFVRVSQGQLGLMLSLSRQTVNGSLKELEAAGTIHRGRGAVEILDVDRLLALGAPGDHGAPRGGEPL